MEEPYKQQLQTIKDNVPKVYEAGRSAGGYDKGYNEGHQEGYNEGHQEGYNEGHQEGYNEGYLMGLPDGFYRGKVEGIEQGKQAEYDAFWKALQLEGERTDYRYAFRSSQGTVWTDETFKPKYDMRPTNADYMFAAFKVAFPDCLNGKVLDFNQCTTVQYCFANYTGTYLPTIDLTSCTNTTGALGWCSNLTTIAKVIVNENTPLSSNLFSNDSALQNIEFDGVIGQNNLNLQWSTKLTKTSIESIIDCLSATTNGLSITLSLNAVKKAFETSSGANDGNSSGEWLNLIATKSKWTINLV